MLSIKEVAEKAKLTEPHIRQLLWSGKINGVKVGKEWRVSLEETNKYLGLNTDKQDIEKELYIKELEGKIKTYIIQMNTMKDLVEAVGNLLDI